MMIGFRVQLTDRLMSKMLVVTVAAALGHSTSLAGAPAVTFQIQPVGKILDDVRSIGGPGGGKRLAADLDKALKMRLGRSGLAGLDLDRPLLGYAVLGDDPKEAVFVLAVPVTSDKGFLGLLERLGAPKPTQGEGGLYVFPTGKGLRKVVMRFDARHAYIAFGAEPVAALEPSALVPAATIHNPAEAGLGSFKVSFDRLPGALRREPGAALRQLKVRLEPLLSAVFGHAGGAVLDQLIDFAPRHPNLLEPLLSAVLGDTGGAVLGRALGIGNWSPNLLRDAEEVTGRLALDAATGEIGVELKLTGKPGSTLANVIAQWPQTTNRFAGLITPDTVVGLRARLQWSGDMDPPLFRLKFKDLFAGWAPPEFETALDKVLKSEFVKMGLVYAGVASECAVSLRGPNKDGFYTLVVGCSSWGTGGLLEEGLVERYKKALPAGVFDPKVAVVGRTEIHQLKPPVAVYSHEALRVFGEEVSLALAFTETERFAVFGPDAVAVMKEALVVAKAPAPPFEMVVNPARIGKLLAAAGGHKPPASYAADKPIRPIAVSVDGGTGLRVKFSIKLSAFGSEGFPLPPILEAALPKRERRD